MHACLHEMTQRTLLQLNVNSQVQYFSIVSGIDKPCLFSGHLSVLHSPCLCFSPETPHTDTPPEAESNRKGNKDKPDERKTVL